MAAVLVALAGLTSCSSSDDSTATDTSGGSSTSSSGSPSADASSPTAGETLDPATFVDDVLGSVEDATTAHLTMTTTGGSDAMTMEGDVDYSANPPEMSVTMTSSADSSQQIGLRIVDGVMYMQMAQLGNGKWLKMDLNGKNSPLSGGLMDQLDPGAGLDAMKDSIDDVTYVGEEDVNGETLQHYTMKVRSKAFMDLQNGSSAGSQLPSLVTYDVWTDSDGMLRQTQIDMGKLGSVTVAMSDWGEPVDISAPPESDIMQMPDGMSMDGLTGQS